jgi:DNA-binding HxlR family transcriptional regulator
MTEQQEPISDVDLLRTLFEGKWRFAVVSNLVDGPQRLSTLCRRIPAASKNMLIDTLHALEALGWVIRVDLSAHLKRVEYYLSEQWLVRLRIAVGKVGAN